MIKPSAAAPGATISGNLFVSPLLGIGGRVPGSAEPKNSICGIEEKHFLMGKKKMFGLNQEPEEGIEMKRESTSPSLALTLCPCSLYLILSPSSEV